ncbi:SHOCT domain-containing protein [Salarchaeum sp. JOR-1]|uniref:SHOCT domain-containing protein n=1 Tax=Salarchaeum sp. JOR-1 TaxID=2599399 RepID=UPI0011988698|nr:SHOCT domain-containing protein [Salarchaeum sp. JOR-1]QDX39382.1 SHOCT domain-containing protein [Salarchaeum sp. JOR-1]
MGNSQPPDGTLRLVVIALAVLVGTPLVVMAVMIPFMGAYGGMMGGYGGYGGMMGGYSPIWGIGLSLGLLLVLAVIGYAAYRVLSGSRAESSTDPAQEELRIAYARGELSDEEYETRAKRLRDNERDGRE